MILGDPLQRAGPRIVARLRLCCGVCWLLIVRRVVFEDAFLRANLAGYAEYRNPRTLQAGPRPLVNDVGGAEPPAGQDPAAVEDQLHGRRIKLVLLDEDPGRQRLHRVVARTGTAACSTIGPASSSLVTRCTVAPVSLTP